MNTYPLRHARSHAPQRRFLNDFLDDRDSGNAEGCVYRYISNASCFVLCARPFDVREKILLNVLNTLAFSTGVVARIRHDFDI